MIRFFTGHPTAANLIMIAVLFIGIVSIPTVKRETFPDVPPDEVQIRFIYPAATAEEVEEAVCRRIEDAVEKVNDVDEIRCEARENQGTAVVKMQQGKNFERFFTEIRTEVEAIDNFPEDTESPIIRQLGLTDFVAAVAVAGPMAPTDLKSYAEDLKERMLIVPEISQVTITGFSDRQIRIEIPSSTLRQYGLSINNIADTIASQSLDLPAGTIETRASDVLIRFNDKRRSPLEFQNLIVVGAASGAEIRLGDIAKITDRFELAEDKVIFNGQRAAVLEITKTKSQDALNVVAAVKTFLDGERQRMPAAMQFKITRDLSSVVEDRLSMIVKNGGQGLILVFLTLWAFFSLRFSFWVAMGFPVSFAATIFVMSLFGMSFDLITLVGLLIGIGLLVDDAIVIAENIAAHHMRGSPPLKAAIDGTKQVAPGVLASYLTTICVFGSLAFLKGDIGAILKWMPIILIVTLTVSLVEAFIILPHHMYKALSKDDRTTEPWLRRQIDRGVSWVRDVVLAGLIDWALRWRYFTVGLALAVFLASISMIAGGNLKFRAFPDIEGNVVEARLLMPQGTPLARSTLVVEQLVAAVGVMDKEFTPLQPDGQALVKNINIQFNKNVDA
ncbi:MAG: efflux RND transporter permease subunit, partial [Proteobacteria bacterium]|nr:efflux RND transporter permease subunit [Pseudomonadota bacterium]